MPPTTTHRASDSGDWPAWPPAVFLPSAPVDAEPAAASQAGIGGRRAGGGNTPERLARRVARAAGAFEYGLLGRPPASVTVVGTSLSMVVHVHEVFSPLERQLARQGESAAGRVRAFHRGLFDRTVEALLEHVWLVTGVMLRGAIAHVDTATASVLKTLATHPDLDLFVLGEGLPALGVPVDVHRRVRGGGEVGGEGRIGGASPVNETSEISQAAGNGAVRR